MNPGRRWIAIVICLLAGNVLAGVALIFAAHHGASRVLPNYYEDGVHYNDAIDQDARNHALAWRVGVSIDHGIATVTAIDVHGQPLDHAKVHIDGIGRSDAGLKILADLVATAPGEYRARVAGTGWVDVSVTIDHGDDRYAHRVAIEAR